MGTKTVEEVSSDRGGPRAPRVPRGPRADSIRNRARILEAAEQVFGSEGLTVPIDRIAEKAGVGVGTLYRHFPTKEALFEAIVLGHFERLLAEARERSESDEPGEALIEVLNHLVVVAVEKRDLADALMGAGIDFKAAAGETKSQLDECLSALLRRAQEEGTIRPDVTYADLMSLVAGSCITNNHVGPIGGSPATMVAVICDGLRLRKS